MKIRRHLLVILLLVAAFAAFGQDGENVNTPDTSDGFSTGVFISENVKLSAEIGANGELYSVSGRPSQRPTNSGRVYFRPSISLFNRINFNFDFFISSEGSGSRQEMNTVGFSPEWSWGKLYYGDFSMEMSKFTLTDVKINGYGIDLFPGVFKFQAFSGKSQKAVALDATSSMYDRTIYGGKIGLGELGGSHFHITFLRAYDDRNSLSRDIFKQIDTVSLSAGSMRIDTNYTGVTPQENLIAGINWGLKLFSGKFSMKSELAVSMYTADMFSGTIENKDIPKDLSKYFSPRLTTSADAALSGEMAMTIKSLQLKGGFTYVGPGYTSLGMGTLINDRQIINGGFGWTLFSGNLVLQSNVQTQTDNVAKQKLYTTSRNTVGFNVAVKPWKALSLMVVSNINTIGNDAKNDTVKVDLKSASFGFNSNLQFATAKLKHILTSGVNNQSSEAINKIRGNNKVSANSVMVGLNTMYSEQLMSTVSANFNSVEALNTKNETKAYSGSLNYKMLANKLTNALSYALVTNDASSSHVIGFQANYQLFDQSSLALNTRTTLYRGKGAVAFKYNETSTTLDWTYRF